MCNVVMLGIVLSWNMSQTSRHESATSYQLFAYQETSLPPSSALWKMVSRHSSVRLAENHTSQGFMNTCCIWLSQFLSTVRNPRISL